MGVVLFPGENDSAGPVTHLHKVDELREILGCSQWIEKDRPSFRADHGHRSSTAADAQSGCKEASVDKPRAGLTELGDWTPVSQKVGDAV